MSTPHTTTAATMTPRDFDHHGTRLGSGQSRTWRWTPEVLDAIIAALDGSPVVIDIDGLCTIGATLVGTRPYGYHPCGSIVVRYHHGDGCTSPRPLEDGRFQEPCPGRCPGYHDTRYPLNNVGVIVPLERRAHSAKWEASNALFNVRRSAASLAVEVAP